MSLLSDFSADTAGCQPCVEFRMFMSSKPVCYLPEDGSIQPETCWSVSQADTAVSTGVVPQPIRSAAWYILTGAVWVGTLMSVHVRNLICVWLRPL